MNTYATIEIDDTIIGNCNTSYTIPAKSRKIDMSKVKQAQLDCSAMRVLMFPNGYCPIFK